MICFSIRSWFMEVLQSSGIFRKYWWFLYFFEHYAVNRQMHFVHHTPNSLQVECLNNDKMINSRVYLLMLAIKALFSIDILYILWAFFLFFYYNVLLKKKKKKFCPLEYCLADSIPPCSTVSDLNNHGLSKTFRMSK